jgi:hypothetical protein
VAEKSLEFIKAKCMTGVRANGSTIGLLATGEIKLDGVSYQAISGPWNKGMLPNATYTVQKYNVVASSEDASFKSASGKGWFIPLKQPANITRSGFGIHPDGNVEGTAGCIGLVGDDADRFWTAWLNLSMADRPGSLVVSGASEAGNETRTISGEGANE